MSDISSHNSASIKPSVYTRWLLNVAYLCAIMIALPAILWVAWRTGKYREGFRAKILGRVRSRVGTRYSVWIHAVSVGEVNLVGVLAKELQRRHPKWEICISTTTKTGYDLACKKYRRNCAVFYCPMDFTWAVKRAVRRIRPDMVLLAELELWPNLIATAKESGAKIAIFNGRLSENSFRGYRRVRGLIRSTMQNVDLIAAQDEATAERFAAIGANPESIRVSGSLKYDGAETDRNNPRTESLRTLSGWGDESTVWLAGSTQEPEEAICLNAFKELHKDHPELKLIIVPRHPERFDEVAELLNESGLAWHRRTELDSAIGAEGEASVLLIDTVGELGAWWGVADIGFVGGSFGDRGGQNMIEPAAYGVATCFGPNTRNFRDIVAALLAADGARVVQTPGELEAFIASCLEMPAGAEALGLRAKEFVASQLGATERTADMLDSISGYTPRFIEQSASKPTGKPVSKLTKTDQGESALRRAA